MLKYAGFFAAALAANASAADAPHTYIVRLSEPTLVEHARRIVDQRDLVGAIGERAALRRQIASNESVEYLHHLDVARAQVLAAGDVSLGRTLQPRHVFRHASNGMALLLTDAEAQRLKSLPGVAGLHRERRERLLTDAGPQWIGADKIWNGQVPGVAKTKGEGVVIGIIDTGINPSHPSFAAKGADGYTITNPRGHFYGLCSSGQVTCTNKLIGIYDFTDEGTHGIDSAGHGSHVSGIAAGNAIGDALQGHTVALQRQVSGVAPHANIIMYKACVENSPSNPDGGCAESDLVAALDQATADGVDVINYSIGGDPVDPYALLDEGGNDAAAMFQARAAGIVVAVAAGNEGPGPGSVDEPGNVPWVITAANSSHNRRFANSIGAFGGASNAPATLQGQGYTIGYGPATIVYAGSYGNALCGVGDSEGVDPTGASNPFAPGTFHGEIVVCDRGTYARVEKGYNVLHAGAGGYVLANTAEDGESVVSDDHFLAAVHLGYSEGAALKSWLHDSVGTHTGKIAGVSAAIDSSFGDILEASSSRGPTGFGGGVLKPDITAPGTNILSAARTGTGLALLTGTSMASPHIAGAAALLVAAHPSWTPAQIESALLGTALSGSVRKEDGVTLGSPLDAGAGRAQPADAARAGLYLPLSNVDIDAQNPAHGGKPEKLNRTGIESENCFGQCSFTRTVADMSGGGTWQVSVAATSGAHVTVTPNQFTLASGAAQALNIAVDVSDPTLPGTWVNGRIVLHKSTGGQSASDTALPLAVYSYPGAKPAFQEITTSGPGDSKVIQLSGLAALPQAQFTQVAPVVPTITNMSLGVDTNSGDLYSAFPGTGKQFVLVPNIFDLGSIAYGSVFIVEVASSNAPRADLYAGIDSNGDGQPEFAEQACASSSLAGSMARCVIDLRNVGPVNLWVLVDIPQSNPAGSYSVKLSSGIPVLGGSGAEYAAAVGPGHVEAGAAFPVRVFWGGEGSFGGLGAPEPGMRMYGALLIDATSGVFPGQIGFAPYALTRSAGNDDVADALEPLFASRFYTISPGESLKHLFVDVPAPGNLSLETEIQGTNTDALDFYVARTDFPAPSVSPDIAVAPSASNVQQQWTLNAATMDRTMNIPVTAGRWYVVAKSNSSSASAFSAIMHLNLSTEVVRPAPGAYYNPERSGHGIFMNDAAGNRALYWYTYLEDGTPTWYQAVASVPGPTQAAWWAPLQRINWDGVSVNAVTTVGEVLLTPINATDFMFSWHLYGTSGSEHFTPLALNECVNVDGAQTDLNGQWFAPAQSGYGMDVLALSRLQFNAFYFYDSLGQPVWAVGESEPFSASSTAQMLQYTGFCPLCAFTSTTTRPIGTLMTNYTNAFSGSYAANLNLLPPLSGAWNINQPIARLTGKATCPP